VTVHRIERVAGRWESGSGDTQAWLLRKEAPALRTNSRA
jgi:hypothetical protein